MAILKKGQEIGVCVHHSVYPQAKNLAELKVQAKLFDGWHSSKSWAEDTKTSSAYPYISYHYLMATDGSMLNVTDEKYVKYHAGDNFRGDLSFNLHGIAVCLTGNYETDKPTDAQMKALVLFIRDIEKKYAIDAMVRGHKETSATATACPGKNLGTSTSGWLKQVIANVNDKNYPPIVKPPRPPEPPEQTECEKEVDRLKTQIGALEATTETQGRELDLLSSENSLLRRNLEKSDAELIQTKSELHEMNLKYNALIEAHNRIVQEKNEAIEKLKEGEVLGQEKFISKIGDWVKGVLAKILGGRS